MQFGPVLWKITTYVMVCLNASLMSVAAKITLLKYSTALTAQAASRSTIYVMVPGTVLMGLMSATVKMLSRFLAR